MKLVMLDRDGVINTPGKYNVKSPAELGFMCCTDDDRESGASKPAPGMLVGALRHFGAKPPETPFVGDQRHDLDAAANAHCRRVLVGSGRKTEGASIPNTVRPDEVDDDLAAFVDASPLLGGRKIRDYHRRRATASE